MFPEWIYAIRISEGIKSDEISSQRNTQIKLSIIFFPILYRAWHYYPVSLSFKLNYILSHYVYVTLYVADVITAESGENNPNQEYTLLQILMENYG